MTRPPAAPLAGWLLAALAGAALVGLGAAPPAAPRPPRAAGPVGLAGTLAAAAGVPTAVVRVSGLYASELGGVWTVLAYLVLPGRAVTVAVVPGAGPQLLADPAPPDGLGRERAVGWPLPALRAALAVGPAPAPLRLVELSAARPGGPLPDLLGCRATHGGPAWCTRVDRAGRVLARSTGRLTVGDWVGLPVVQPVGSGWPG